MISQIGTDSQISTNVTNNWLNLKVGFGRILFDPLYIY